MTKAAGAGKLMEAPPASTGGAFFPMILKRKMEMPEIVQSGDFQALEPKNVDTEMVHCGAMGTY